ncbi:methyltransferase family protein [Psychrobacter urativorans]|uniref:Isoprenylcysteine carboxyl methyltransferase n=1 Tax=Psychrobacter urativorans TaxID=45610 RepID=A0A0M3V937_9GAMM|nr:DUF1295 domain-containing protein [Psychrobacter urativorans]ALF59957.1 isoprenylcysteine carboxyl methyltransferase [Psychrobacter urativorans]
MISSVHTSPRQASAVLALSFLIGYLVIKLYLIDYFDIEYLVRGWLFICITPLIVLAYIQNPYKRGKQDLSPINNIRVKSKTIVFLLQFIIIYIYAFAVTQSGLADYAPFVNDLFFTFPLIMALSVIYIFFSDRRLLEPEDEYAKIGAMLNRRTPLDKAILQKFLLKTAVKIVFVPFMYSGFLGNLSILLNTAWHFNSGAVSLLLFNFGVSIDMLIGIFGYLFSSAIINNQIIDTDSNFLGWLFALLCYPPLVWIMRQVNDQQDSLVWNQLIPQDNILYWILFIIINMTWVVYWLATFEFGMTFSNLSYRRLIDKGVYRYSKHPAYIAKNIYWWLYTLPFMGVAFISVEWWKNILGLTFVSLIYYGRAKSEERHLMKFPEYRQYCSDIEKKGIFRWLKSYPTY